MPTLKQAQSDPEAMKQFIEQHKSGGVEPAEFDAVVSSMMAGAGKPKEAPKA